jgi:hypothetical protein
VTVLYSYVIGWVITTIGLVLVGRRQSRPTSVAVVVGAAWPLLLLGAVQFVAVALIAEAARVREPGPKSIDDELEELLTEWAICDGGAHDRGLPVTTGSDNAHQSSAENAGQSVACP